MTIAKTALRAFLGLPFLALAYICVINLDLDKLKSDQTPFADARKVTWDDGASSFTVREGVYNNAFFDDLWRGAAVTFAPSTLGFDPVSSWQFFCFLIDLGPLFAVWTIEACRPATKAAWSPAALPSLFTFFGQMLGIGTTGPVMYFLGFVFGPSASDLMGAGKGRALVHSPSSSSEEGTGSKNGGGGFSWLLPAILVFHTGPILASFLAPDLEVRHYWIYFWQMSPVMIAVTNFVLSKVLPSPPSLASKEAILFVLGVVSTGVWLNTVLFSPFPLSTMFLPVAEPQTDWILHSRRAFQFDHLSIFAATFLYEMYMWVDFQMSGLAKGPWMHVFLLPVLVACLGPASAFATSWVLREKVLNLHYTRNLKA